MKTMTGLMKALIVVVVLSVLLLGWGTVWSHFQAIQAEGAEKISSVASDSHEAARIRFLLKGAEEKILSHQDKLADAENERAQIEAQMKALRSEVDKQKGILAKAKAILAGPTQETVEVSGKQYTRQAIEEDAISRVTHVKTVAENLKLKDQVLGRLNAAIRDGQANLIRAKHISQDNAEKLKLLELRLQNARVIASVTTFTSGISEDPLGPQTEIGVGIRLFEKRVASIERRNDVVGAETRGGMVVDYDNAAKVSALDAIDGILGSGSSDPAGAAPQATAPPAGRNALNALQEVLEPNITNN